MDDRAYLDADNIEYVGMVSDVWRRTTSTQAHIMGAIR